MRKTYYHITSRLLTAAASAILLIAASSCNDYLDTTPSKGSSEVLDKSEQIEGLFNNSENFNTKATLVAAECDDMGMTTDLYDQTGYLGEDFANGLSFDIDAVEAYPYGDKVWNNLYNKVFIANLVLENMDEVEDLTADNRAKYLAQAHFTRALALWNLAQIYCRPYATSTSDTPGLPLKTSTSYEENTDRGTLATTYKFIYDDLKAAQQTAPASIDKRWWVSQPAVSAMLARYFLFTCQYDSAAVYADKALASNNATLQDYNEIGIEKESIISPDGVSDSVTYSDLYELAPNELADYQENYFSQYAEVESGIYLIPSESLTALYDTDNDLRYRLFFSVHGLWAASLDDGGDSRMWHKFHHYAYDTDLIEIGPTVPEMLLTKAEAEARLGKVSEAMTSVNTLRKARMDNSADDVELSASNQEEAVKAILDERHREMPYLMRWADIRRLAYNEVDYDDVTVTREFYEVEDGIPNTYKITTYTLPVRSPRYAQPISDIEIKRSGNQIKQNEY